MDRLVKIMADGGYAGKLIDWVAQNLKTVLEIVKRTELHTFKILPKRWIVERTFSWLNKYRRLSKDYEHTTASRLAFVTIAHIRLVLARVTNSQMYNWDRLDRV